MSGYYQALVCVNGHLINEMADENPAKNGAACSRCGAATTSTCSKCGEIIRGSYWESTGYYIQTETCRLANFCHACGKAYPWTERKTQALKDMLIEVIEQEAERLNLEESIPDIITETPRSNIAILRFNKAIVNAGKIGGKALYDLLINIAAATIAKKITG